VGGILVHLVPSICIGFLLQLILHETGHLVFGLLTGWEFIFLQIHRLIIKSVDKKLKLIFVRDKNYRCIMSPKSIDQDALLYTMGGCIINLASAIAGFAMMAIVRTSPLLWLNIWSFSAFGAGLFFMNGTSRIYKVCNDKACYNLLKEKPHTKLCHNAQLIIARYLAEGLTYSRIGKGLLCLCPKTAGNDIEAYQAVLEYYYYLDKRDYNGAGQALDKIKSTVRVSKEISDIVQTEQTYLKFILLLNHNNTSLNNIFPCNLKEFCKKGDIHSLRVSAAVNAYEELKAGHINNALDILSKAKMMIDKANCVYEGEKIFCIRQLEDMKKLITGKI